MWINFVNNLKSVVDTPIINGHFLVNDKRAVAYILGTDSFYLDVDSSIQKIFDSISKEDTIELSGVSDKAVNDENYKLIREISLEYELFFVSVNVISVSGASLTKK